MKCIKIVKEDTLIEFFSIKIHLNANKAKDIMFIKINRIIKSISTPFNKLIILFICKKYKEIAIANNDTKNFK